jgi:hypothetical protein
MTGSPSNGVSTREHIEQIIARIERSVTEKFDALREDIKHLQANYVTRHEYDAVVGQLQRDVERLDREQRASFSHAEKTASDELREFKDDLRADQNRLFAVIGVGFAILQIILSLLIK